MTRTRKSTIDFAAMRTAAEAVLERAYAPYSRLHVAAVLRDGEGRLHHGVNVENASFGLTVCAERNALATAVGAGARTFSALVVISTAERGAITPCGACRQVLAELAPAIPVRCYGRDGSTVTTSTDALLPHAFSARSVPARARAKARSKPRR